VADPAFDLTPDGPPSVLPAARIPASLGGKQRGAVYFNGVRVENPGASRRWRAVVEKDETCRYRRDAIEANGEFGTLLTQAERDEKVRRSEDRLRFLHREITWIRSEIPFDFNRSYVLEDGLRLEKGEAGEAFEFQVQVQRDSTTHWDGRLSVADLAWLRDFDRQVSLEGDSFLPAYGEQAPWLCEQAGSGRYMLLELVAAGSEIARRDPTFWPRLRDRGATAALVRVANDLLRQTPQEDRADYRAADNGVTSARARRPRFARTRPCTRGIAATRRRRTRRVSSRTGDSGDGGGGGSGPGSPRPIGRRGVVAVGQ
jgi:hypothetical protein